MRPRRHARCRACACCTAGSSDARTPLEIPPGNFRTCVTHNGSLRRGRPGPRPGRNVAAAADTATATIRRRNGFTVALPSLVARWNRRLGTAFRRSRIRTDPLMGGAPLQPCLGTRSVQGSARVASIDATCAVSALTAGRRREGRRSGGREGGVATHEFQRRVGEDTRRPIDARRCQSSTARHEGSSRNPRRAR